MHGSSEGTAPWGLQVPRNKNSSVVIPLIYQGVWSPPFVKGVFLHGSKSCKHISILGHCSGNNPAEASGGGARGFTLCFLGRI